MPVPAETVRDLYDALRAVTDHTRPAFDPEILVCLNYGYQTTVRAVASVRSQFLVAYWDPVTIPAATTPDSVVELDLSWFEPPLWRPTRMVLQDSGRAIQFRYQSQLGLGSRASESSRAGGFTTLYYDMLYGRLPGQKSTITSFAPLTVANPEFFPLGQRIQVYPSPATTIFPLYYGTVTRTAPLEVAPPFAPGFDVGGMPRTIIQTRSRVMRLANMGTQDYTGRLYYTYRPAKFRDLDELLDPIVAEHRDIIVYYAISMYLRAVNDNEANAWFQNAQLLRSELMQDLEPLSNENSEHLESDLWGWE